MFSDEQVNELVELLSTLDRRTRLYFGCDSVAFKREGVWFARFATVLIVHVNGKNGCHIFRTIDTDRVFDKKKNRPVDRLMKEVYRVTALYNQLIGLVDEFETEIHVDVSLDKEHGSSCVATQAAGYILGTTGIDEKHLKFKPNAILSSIGADGIVRGYDTRQPAAAL